MDFQFVDTKNTATKKIGCILWLAAILGAFADMLDWMQYAPFLLPGLLLPLIPGKYRKALYGILGMVAIYSLVRLESIGYLANRLFALSEAAQSYEYDYFTVSVTHPGEGFVMLSLLLGCTAALWENRANLLLTALLLIAVAYFGIAPGLLFLALLVIAAACNLSGQGNWLNILLILVTVLVIAGLVTQLAPEPLEGVSSLDEQLRDVLSGNSVYYEHQPIPNPVPEPEKVPPPPESAQQPDRGIMDMAVNILFILFSVIALVLLFIPAIIKDRAEKKRKANRAFLEEANNAAAIRGMYLYARKWRALDAQPEPIPQDVESIWLEAAYSDHALTDEQKEIMRAFVRSSAEAVWQKADWKQKLLIKYKHAL